MQTREVHAAHQAVNMLLSVSEAQLRACIFPRPSVPLIMRQVKQNQCDAQHSLCVLTEVFGTMHRSFGRDVRRIVGRSCMLKPRHVQQATSR